MYVNDLIFAQVKYLQRYRSLEDSVLQRLQQVVLQIQLDQRITVLESSPGDVADDVVHQRQDAKVSVSSEATFTKDA